VSEPGYLIVLVSCPTTALALSMGRALVEEQLAACVHVMPGVTAIYRWQGSIEEDPQTVLVVKTCRAAWSRLAERVQELHTDEVPEILALPIEEGLQTYLRWIDSVVGMS